MTTTTNDNLINELNHYKSGYEQANSLCSQLMEMSESLQTQVDTMKQQMLTIKQEEEQKYNNEINTLKQQFVEQLSNLKDQFTKEKQQIKQQTQNEYKQLINNKNIEIEQLQGQLTRLFDHYNSNPIETSINDNKQSKKVNNDNNKSFNIEDHEEYLALEESIKSLQILYDNEKKRANDLESQNILLERIKNTLKTSTDKIINENNERIKELENENKQLSESLSNKNNNNNQDNTNDNNVNTIVDNNNQDSNQDNKINDNNEEEKLQLQTEIANLTRKLSEITNDYSSATQEITLLKFQLENKNEETSLLENNNNNNISLENNNKQLQEQNNILSQELITQKQLVKDYELNLKENKTLQSELQQEIKHLTSLLEKEQENISNLQSILKEQSNNTKNIDDNEDYKSKYLQSQLSIQTHQNTISDLQQQCSVLRQEILDRDSLHKSQIDKLINKNNQLENAWKESLSKQTLKVKEYNENYTEIEKQLDLIIQQMEELHSLKDKYECLNQDYESLHNQLLLTEKDLQAHKELLYQERKNIEASKEISCDLQKHILSLSQDKESLQEELNNTRKAYEEFQLEATRQKKLFEQEKNSIVYDLLHKQLYNNGTSPKSDLPKPNVSSSSVYTPNNSNHFSNETPSKIDEKKSISLVKQKLIDELWKESWDMTNSPNPIDNTQ